MLRILLRKDLLLFKRNFLIQKKKNLWNLIWNGVLLGMILATLIYVFYQTIVRAAYYDFAYELFTIVLEGLILFLTVVAVPSTAKSLFKEGEHELMSLLPFPLKTIATSKVFTIFFKQLISLSIAYIPFYLAFGFACSLEISYYLSGIIMLVPACVFIVFVTLMLSYPYQFIRIKLRNQRWIKFAAAIIIALGFSLLYQAFLDFFISLIQEDRLSHIFNYETIGTLRDIGRFLYPASLITEILKKQNLAFAISTLSIATIALGAASFFIFCFFYQRKLQPNPRQKIYKETSRREFKITAVLFKKERILITRDFTSLTTRFVMLISVVFILTVIIPTLNKLLFRNFGELQMIYTLTIFLIVSLFYCLVNSFSALITSKDNIELIKQLPISFRKQTNVKLTIAFSVSLISLTATMLSLFLTNNIALFEGLIIWASINFLNLFLFFYSLIYETKHLSSSDQVVNNTNLVVVSLMVPTIITAFSAVGYWLGGTILMELTLLILCFLLALFMGYYYYLKIEKIFQKLEVQG